MVRLIGVFGVFFQGGGFMYFMNGWLEEGGAKGGGYDFYVLARGKF